LRETREFAENRSGVLAPSIDSDLRMIPANADPRRTAVYTGTFDPLTLGHLDVIRRGSTLFDHLVVGIGVNPNKQMLFDIEERVALARRVVSPFLNVTVEPFHELAVQFVRRIGARIILRGVRTLSDMEYEFSMTLTNLRLDPAIETVFLMADGEYSHVSSSLIKQVASFGGEAAIARFVPAELVSPIMTKIRQTSLD
jgi:pantetheine-phosphate adenylyltransferase